MFLYIEQPEETRKPSTRELRLAQNMYGPCVTLIDRSRGWMLALLLDTCNSQRLCLPCRRVTSKSGTNVEKSFK